MEVLLLAESIKRPKRQAETEIAAEAVEEVEPNTGIHWSYNLENL